MAHWLFKSDPDTYGWPELAKDKHAVWDGVSNPVALRNLRSCKKGDQVFIYHTGDEKAIIGIAEITKEAYPDPKKKEDKLVVVEIKAIKKIGRPVALSEIKAQKDFADFALVRLPRLSVMPVDEKQWRKILSMA
jgi:predicted RNA-binding protein with PUA-like domain